MRQRKASTRSRGPCQCWDFVREIAASEIEEHHALSFWDALIIAAAVASGASKILSEDFNPGQTIEGVLIENPFGS